MNQKDKISSIHGEEQVVKEEATYKPHSDPQKIRERQEERERQQAAAQPEPKPEAQAEESAETTEKQEPPADKYEQLQAEYAELDDKYKRLWADQQNITKRMNREREDLHKYAASSTIEAILPALDNFDFALKSMSAETSSEDLLKGIDMLRTQLLMSLQSVGLEEINASGSFNPEQHEAVSKVKDPEQAEGTIVEVVKKGFKLRDKVIRAASVVVSTQSE